MSADEAKRKWFEEVPIEPTFSHARTKPVVVEKVKKHAHKKQPMGPNEKPDLGPSGKDT